MCLFSVFTPVLLGTRSQGCNSLPVIKSHDENSLLLLSAYLFIFKYVFADFALKCHYCSSTKSWEDCERVHGSSTRDCSYKDAVCYKVHYSTNDGRFNQYAKSCGPKSSCKKEANPVCKGHPGPSDCDVICCDENLCNRAGSVITGNGALFATTTGVLLVIRLVI